MGGRNWPENVVTYACYCVNLLFLSQSSVTITPLHQHDCLVDDRGGSMDYQQPHGLPNHWVRNYSTDSASLTSLPTDRWDTSSHGIVGGMRDGAVSGLHSGRSAPLEYNGHDITAQLREGAINQLAPGTLVLGRFYVERSLGKGGMSNVYLGQDRHFTSQHNLRSLKEMIGRLDEQNNLSNFEREANVLASLRHPRI